MTLEAVTAWTREDPAGDVPLPGRALLTDGLNAGGEGTAAPTTGYWRRGDVTFNTLPAVGGFLGWVCVASGSPGTWYGFGQISSSIFDLSDTGWDTAGFVIDPVWFRPHAGYPLMVRRVGNLVRIQGILELVQTISGGTTDIGMFTVAAAYRPTVTQDITMGGIAGPVGSCFISAPSGLVVISGMSSDLAANGLLSVGGFWLMG